MAINGVTTTIVNGILSCLHSNARFIGGKSWKISLFPKPVGENAKTSILPTTYFKQFLCSSRLASTFGKSLSAVFVASLNSAWRHVESVITAISHFSLWSKTLHCWQKLSKSTNQRVYQDLVYRNALLLKILTSVPAPLSPAPLYFSSLSLLRTALHYLNAWNRLVILGDKILSYVNSSVYLGVVIDSRLSWQPQITAVCKSFSRKVESLTQLRVLPRRVLEAIYFRTIVPSVTYVVLVLGNLYPLLVMWCWTDPLKSSYLETHSLAALN